MRKKNFLLSWPVLFVVLILCVFYNSCNSCETNGDTNSIVAKLKEKIKVQERTIAALREQLEIDNTNKPETVISLGKVQEIYRNYNKRDSLIRKTVVEETGNKDFQATRSIFYPINRLRNYLGYIDRISQEANIRPTGLRFYFALYSDKENREGYKNRQTFFVTPTLTDKKNKRIDIGYTLRREVSEDLQDTIITPFFLTDEVLNSDDGLVYGPFTREQRIQEASFFTSYSATIAVSEIETADNTLGSSPPR